MVFEAGFMSANAVGILQYKTDRIWLFFGDRIVEKIVVMGGRREDDSGRAWIRWRMKTSGRRCV